MSERERRRLGPIARRRITLVALAAGAFAAVALAQRDVGVARDERVYIDHGRRYARWWIDLLDPTGAGGERGVLSEKRITATFGGPRPTDGNREHPPLMKTLIGLSQIALHDELGWSSQITAARLPAAAMNALTVAMVFWFGAAVWGYGAGLVAALLVLLLPRAFFHAGLATFDAPVVTVWLATLLAYYRALGSRWWCAGLALAFGLALATKHNALLLPGVIGLHYAYLAWRRSRSAGPTSIGGRLLAFVRGAGQVRPLVFAALAAGPLVLVAVWPWLWFDSIAHVRDWITFHTSHVHYNFEYLGTNYNHPPFPWHLVLVTTLFTVPTATLVAAAMGAVHLAGRAARRTSADPDRAPALLLVVSAAIAMGIFLVPSTPIFGAEKHWAAAIPSLCLAAGIGVVAASDRLMNNLVAWRWVPAGAAGFARTGAVASLAALVVTAALSETAAAHPYALSHYTALAGGPPGGADLGMNRQFWGVSARGVLPFLNQFAPGPGEPPVQVYSHDAQPAWGLYRRAELLSPGLPDAGAEASGIARSQIALVIHERHFARHDYLVWDRYGTVQPSHILTTFGVPIVSVYVRPDLSPPKRGLLPESTRDQGGFPRGSQERHSRVLKADP
jgi:hypothetical protein